MKFLIAGLGNPGEEYQNTRHNIGFLILDEVAARLKVKFQTEKYAWIAEGKVKGRHYLLMKPATFMNLSGQALRYWLQKSKLPPASCLVVVDDLNLPLGKIRIREKGSHGGHNGLENIEQELGHPDYPRLRFGIGNDFRRGRQVDFVLGAWTSEEKKLLEEPVSKAADAVLDFGLAGLERIMNQYNSR